MRKHIKFGVIAVVAVLVLTVGITTTAFAFGSTGDEGNGDNGPMQTFISKVASILGLDESQVSDAFAQARQEMRDEALGQRLDKAVEDGLITQDEAAQIQDWWQSRPAAMENLGQFRLRNARHNHPMLMPSP